MHLHERRSNASLGPVPIQSDLSIKRLQQIHPPRRCARRRLGGQPQICEDALDGWGLLNGCDELQLPATLRALLDVDIAIPTARFNKRAKVMRDCALPVGVCAQSPA